MEMNEWNDYGMIFLGVCHSPGWMGSVESVGAWHIHAREAPFAVLCTACWSAQRSSLQTAPRREPKAPASRRSDAAAPSVRPHLLHSTLQFSELQRLGQLRLESIETLVGLVDLPLQLGKSR